MKAIITELKALRSMLWDLESQLNDYYYHKLHLNDIKKIIQDKIDDQCFKSSKGNFARYVKDNSQIYTMVYNRIRQQDLECARIFSEFSDRRKTLIMRQALVSDILDAMGLPNDKYYPIELIDYINKNEQKIIEKTKEIVERFQ